MPLTRILARPLLVGALVIAGLARVPTPVAWACGVNESPDILCSNEQQFVNDLSARRITSQSQRELANLGWQICGDLHQGRSQEFEANRVYAYYTDLRNDGARAVVTVAVADLCPEAAGSIINLPPGNQAHYNLP